MEKIDESKLQKCINDLRKIFEAENLLKGLSNKCNTTTNTENYLKYILEQNVVKTFEEVFFIVNQMPEISSEMANAIREYGLKDIQDKSSNSSSSSSCDYRHSGTYDKLSDVPGYGTEFNERCVPKGVSIRGRGKNERC